MADRIELQLDLGHSTEDAKQLSAALQTMKVDAAAVGVEMGAFGGSTRNLGSTVIQTSYAIQDFTSQLGTRGLAGAFAAVQNNIPPILAGLGMTGGIAGALSIVAVGAGVVYENWDKIATLWRDGETLKEAERQKELAKSIDAVREATEKQLATPSAAALKPGGDLGKAIKEFGGDQVRKELEKAYREQFGNFGDEHTRQAVTDIIGGVQKGDAQSRSLLGQMTDSTFIHRDSDVMRRLRGEKTSVEQANDLDKLRKNEAAANAKAAADFKARQDAKGKLVDDLNSEGQANEKAWRASAKADQADRIANIKKGLELPGAPGVAFDAADAPTAEELQAMATRGEFGSPRQTYRPMSHADRIAANRRRKARRADSIDAGMMGPPEPEGGVGSEDQRLLAMMRTLIEINNRRAQQARQFRANIDSLPPLMDEGNQ